jgi:hypothetical protein
MQIVRVDRSLRREDAMLVRFSMDDSSSNTTARHPRGENEIVVLTPRMI